MYTVENFQADLENPYAWPGGYPRFFLTSDGDALSFAAALTEASLIETAIRDNSTCGWKVVGCQINWEDEMLFCSHTGSKIESAYGE